MLLAAARERGEAELAVEEEGVQAVDQGNGEAAERVVAILLERSQLVAPPGEASVPDPCVAESSADGGDAPGGSDPNLVRQRNLVIVDKNAAAEAAKAEEAAARWVWVGVWRGVESVCEEEEEEEEETVLVHAVKGDRRQSRRWATVRSRGLVYSRVDQIRFRRSRFRKID